MKVAHLLRKYDPDEWAGTETAVLHLATGLRELGVESVVFAPALPPPAAGRTAAEDVFASAGITVRRFHAFNPVWGLGAEAHRQLTAVGGNLLSFDAPFRLAAEAGVDVIHAHTQGRLAGIARLVARLRRRPLVITIHGGMLDLPPEVREELARPSRGGLEWGKLFGFLLGARDVVRHADAVLTCNPREAELQRAAHPERRVVVMDHGIPTELFAADQRPLALDWLPALRGRQTLLVAARIDPTKNQGWLVEQMPRILERHSDAVLVLVGPVTGHAYARRVGDRVRELGLERRVLLPGPLPPHDERLRGLYQQAEVMILPSVAEPFGLVLLEAWAARTPVLASRTSGALHLVRPGENGALFGLDDQAGFHDALDAMLADGERRRAMGEAGYLRVEHDFSTTQVARRVRNIYAELLAARRR